MSRARGELKVITGRGLKVITGRGLRLGLKPAAPTSILPTAGGVDALEAAKLVRIAARLRDGREDAWPSRVLAKTC